MPRTVTRAGQPPGPPWTLRPLPPSRWRGYGLEFEYETSCVHEARLTHGPSGFGVRFTRRPFPAPVTKRFTDRLYPPHWPGAEAYGWLRRSRLEACLEVWREEWSNRLRVTELWVAAPWRRRGLGGAMMDLAVRRARETGCRALVLETQSCNDAALAFYRARGLSFFGFDRAAYGNHDVRDGEVRVEMGMYL